MSAPPKITTKENVRRFDDDVRRGGSYAYTTEKLSCRFANDRISACIAESYRFDGKTVLDLGCGDGTYTLLLASLGVSRVLGIDPAAVAVEAAIRKARDAGLSDRVSFAVGDIYRLGESLGSARFDCIVLRGVLHHLPDPAGAIKSLSSFGDAVVILEPNGYNPVLKILEKVSRYHVQHEERSFLSTVLQSWCRSADLRVVSVRYLNLVPMFCPDWMAKLCKMFEPLVERVPVIREICCGQCLIVARPRR